MSAAARSDFLVIGGGMAGLSCGYELAKYGAVTVLEREAHAGTQATGNSAALYVASYGNDAVRLLNRASRAFFDAPPEGFAHAPLLTPRPSIYAAKPEDVATLDDIESGIEDGLRRIGRDEILSMVPIMRPECAVAGLYEPGTCDIDVDAMLQGYLRGLRGAGGTFVTGAEAVRIVRTAGRWHFETPAGSFSAPVLVNATGAWADVVAQLAGVSPIGLSPKRRSVAVVDAPAIAGFADWPCVVDARETYYFKPEAGRLMISPADETPCPPVIDVRPEEEDIAQGIARFEEATTHRVTGRPKTRAGLRTFTRDHAQAIGFDAAAPGFFWFAGQGGYGIQSAPAAARLAAAVAAGMPLPESVAHIDPALFSPGRFG